MAFDVTGARAAGYSDSEIASHLADETKFNLVQAKKAGYSDSEIIDHLAPGGSSPKPVDASSTHEMALKRAKEFEDKAAAERANQPGVVGKALGMAGEFAKGVGDTALNLGSQVVAVPAAGIAGIVQGAKNVVSPGMPAADRVAQVSNAMTYQPQSDVGKEAQANIAAPVQWLGDKADKAGQIAADVTGSPAVGTAVNTAIQAAPALIAPEVRGAVGSFGRAAVNAGRTVAAKVGGGTIAAAPAAATATVSPAALGTAKAYVANTLGLDWNALARATQDKLTSIAQTAGNFDNLDPAAIAREAKLQALPVPVPATAGALARDRVALRNEGNVATTTAGQPIADIHLAGNQALLDNLDFLKGKVTGSGATAATASTPEEVGAAVQGAARGKQLLAKAKTKAAYDTADASPEAQVKVDTQPIRDLISKLPDADQFKYAKGWLERNTEGDGSGTKVIDLQELRKLATRKAANGGEDAAYAHDIMDKIDSATEAVAGPLYKQARAAHIAERAEFNDQAAVADLVDNNSRTDRATALSNTVKAVTSGAPEQIRQVKTTLLTGGNEATRTAGRQAWREVRAQVVQQIKDDATKSVAPLEDGSPNLTPGALQQALKRYGPQKLDEIFGTGTTRQLNAILDAAKDVKTIPSTGGGSVGSSTLQNALAFLEKGLIAGSAKVPVIGKFVSGGLQIASDVGGAARTTKAATTTPLSQAFAKANSKASRADLARQAAGATKIIPLSALGQRSQ